MLGAPHLLELFEGERDRLLGDPQHLGEPVLALRCVREQQCAGECPTHPRFAAPDTRRAGDCAGRGRGHVVTHAGEYEQVLVHGDHIDLAVRRESTQMCRGAGGHHEYAPDGVLRGEQAGEDRGGRWPPGYPHPGRQLPTVGQGQVPGVETAGGQADAGAAQQYNRAGQNL